MAIKGFFGEYRFLSNFYPAPVRYELFLYPTTEHAYQAAKTNDQMSRMKISGLRTAAEAKRFGRKVKMRAGWDGMKLSIMEELLRKKFEWQELAKMLLATGEQYLEETNTWRDTYWGVCQGQGQNHLGKLLMKIRQELKER